MNFFDAYPLSAQEVLHFPLMFPDALKRYRVPGIAWPTLAALYETGSFSGLSQGAVRTCLSRMKKDGYVIPVEEGGKTRYRASRLQLSVMDSVIQRKQKSRKGFLVAVYSFEKDKEQDRARARAILTYAGFVRFAQNSFINVCVDDEQIRAALAKEGLARNVYLFRVPKMDSADLDTLAAACKIPERESFLRAFLADVTAFLNEGDGTDADTFNRVGRAWVAFIIHVHATEPPLGDELLPKDYTYRYVYQLLTRASARHGKAMYRHWKSINS